MVKENKIDVQVIRFHQLLELFFLVKKLKIGPKGTFLKNQSRHKDKNLFRI